MEKKIRWSVVVGKQEGGCKKLEEVVVISNSKEWANKIVETEEVKFVVCKLNWRKS